MQPDATHLVEIAGIRTPLIGFYDAPDPSPFEPWVEPAPGARVCVFAFYRRWLQGEVLRITRENPGCRGAGHWLCNLTTRSREDFVRFVTLFTKEH